MAIRKLYPPLIGSRIPAFYQDYNDNLVIKVPYEHNRAVSHTDYETIALRLKTVQNDIVCFVVTTPTEDKNNVLTYIVPPSVYQESAEKWKVNLGQYYQLQLTYLSRGNLAIGYYSSVGITKFSSLPQMAIEDLDSSATNVHKYTYKGTYSQRTQKEVVIDEESEYSIMENTYWDITEKVYNYKFIIKDLNGEIIEDTGWLLHNSATDEHDYESFDSFTYLGELENGATIQYLIETNSGITAETEEYKISSAALPPEYAGPQAILNYDEGYVSIKLEDLDFNTYTYYIVRESVNGIKNKIHLLDSLEFKDQTIEQGETYKYYLYTFLNDTVTGITSLTPEEGIWIDFEDIFLSDASGRQLKIRFNPNVSQFKTTIFETKTDTIGGMYPVINRNGDSKYKEFPISGLISFHIDENGMFLPKDENDDMVRDGSPTERNFDAINKGYIYKRERYFREEVNKWLQNGEPKLFRSPQEGNVLVRLINVNLTPYNGTDRMLYTFNVSAIEIDSHDFMGLYNNNFYKIGGIG